MNLLANLLLAFLLVAPFTLTARAQDVGVSTSDNASYSGAFSIENPTRVVIHYEYKWGESKPWKKGTLQPGDTDTLSYPLGDNKATKVPTPFVRFDRIGGDTAYTAQEYRMQFYAVGYAGYGPAANTTQPKRYLFRYAPDGRTLDLKAR